METSRPSALAVLRLIASLLLFVAYVINSKHQSGIALSSGLRTGMKKASQNGPPAY